MKKLIIKGNSDIKSIGILWGITGAFFIILTIFLSIKNGSLSSQPLFYSGVAWTIALVAALENSVHYIIDEKGITRKSPLRSSSFQWEEFKFISDFYQNGLIKGTDHWIICSKHSRPLTSDGKADRNYRWSRKDSVLIRWRDDEFYREFLSYCGGERDIHE